MTKQDLLKNIVLTGYNVGYAAKKHFATYDLASKAPGFISSCSAGVGVFGLVVEFPSKKLLSAAFLFLGLIALRINMWDHKKEDYADTGRKLTDLFNRLRTVYYNVKAAAEQGGLDQFEKELEAIQIEYGHTGKSSQMMFSDWYAHYKFFWQQQIDWLEEQKQFSLWRDKIPLSLTIVCALIFLFAVGLAIARCV